MNDEAFSVIFGIPIVKVAIPSMHRQHFVVSKIRLAFRTICLSLILNIPAFTASYAADIYDGNMLDVRWDNTMRYTAAFRLAPADSTILASFNGDDGDRNFDRGLIANRLELLSRLDLSHGDFGLHVSAAGWYDTVYHTRTANHSPGTYNPIGTPNTEFSPAVRDLHGQHAELRDAFVYGSFSVMRVPISFRLGRQTLIWGESLFFDDSAIAAAQVPVDYTNGFFDRTDYAADTYLPVGQLSLAVQPVSELSFSFYYQFEWRSSRQPGDGSYFGTVDYVGAGANRLFLTPQRYLVRTSDKTPPAGGQYGFATHLTVDDITLGAYALRFNSKDPVARLFYYPSSSGRVGEIGTYKLAYPEGIELYGLSFSATVDTANIAGEVSYRHNMPTTQYAILHPQNSLPHSNAAEDGYDLANQFDARLSVTTTLRPSRLWDGADLSVEIAADSLASIPRSVQGTDITPDRFVLHSRVRLEPHYFEILPNLDLTVPIDIGHDIVGYYANYPQYSGTNDIAIGISAIYRSLWKADIMLTDFIGTPSYQPLADRAFVRVSLERTF